MNIGIAGKLSHIRESELQTAFLIACYCVKLGLILNDVVGQLIFWRRKICARLWIFILLLENKCCLCFCLRTTKDTSRTGKMWMVLYYLNDWCSI